MGKIWDISPPLDAEIAVWPGDTNFALERTWRLGPDCPVNVSRLTLSTHTGAHADAPSHFDPGGDDSAAGDLTAYLGICRLVDVSRDARTIVGVEALGTGRRAPPPRILLRTYRERPRNPWEAGFAAIDPALIDRLAAAGVRLIGVDTPSLDPEHSQAMEAHHRAYAHRMAILEGLDLAGVPEGDYELIALPLKLVGADASPLRAVLRELP